MDKPGWGWTLFTQASLCLALFLAFKMGEPQRPSLYTNNANTREDEPLDLHFISVRGGSRPLKQQTHLLKQMEKVAKLYKVKFVVNISELGEDDPLTHNGTLHFTALKVPWYATRASQEQGKENFLKQITIPHGKILDILGVDTVSLQDYLHMGQPNSTASNQLHWLRRTLEVTSSDWYDQNAYLSKQGCTGHYSREGGIAYIGNPGPTDNATHKAPSVNGSFAFSKKMNDGFLLHRISALEMVSYFINSASKVIFEFKLNQRGKEFM